MANWYDNFDLGGFAYAGGAPKETLNWNPTGPIAGNPFKAGTQEFAQWSQNKAGPTASAGDGGVGARAAAAATAEAKAKAERDAAYALEEGVLAKMQSYVAGSEKLPDLYNRLSNTPEIKKLRDQLKPLQDEVLAVEGQMRHLPGDVAEVTAGYGESRRRLVEAYKQKDLSLQMSDLVRAQERIATQLADAMSGVGTQANLHNEQFRRDIDMFQTELGVFSERASRAATGYTEAQQSTLDAILQDIDSVEKFVQNLTLQEKEQAFKLAQDEQNYEREKDLIKINFANDLKLKSMSGSGTAKPTATERALQGLFSALNPEEGSVDPRSASWHYIHNNEQIFRNDGVDLSKLWAVYNSFANGSAPAPTTQVGDLINLTPDTSLFGNSRQKFNFDNLKFDQPLLKSGY